VEVLHAWCMTGLSPIGTACSLRSEVMALTDEQCLVIQSKQGRALFGIDMKIVGIDGQDLPWDGKSAGELHVRGHWVVASYLRGENACTDGWFPTGDLATIDRYGYMQIMTTQGKSSRTVANVTVVIPVALSGSALMPFTERQDGAQSAWRVGTVECRKKTWH